MLTGKSFMYGVCHAESVLFCFLESNTSAWCMTPIACALELRQCSTDPSMIGGHCPRLLQWVIVLIHHSKSTTVKMVCNHLIQTQQFRNATLASFQYLHFRGHSSAMCTSQFNIRRNDFKEIQSLSNSLTCFNTFSRALGFFMLIYVHGVPPVHGRLIRINGFTSPLKELTYSAILIWFSTSLRSNSSVNCNTSQPSDHFRLVWLSLDSG